MTPRIVEKAPSMHQKHPPATVICSWLAMAENGAAAEEEEEDPPRKMKPATRAMRDSIKTGGEAALV